MKESFDVGAFILDDTLTHISDDGTKWTAELPRPEGIHHNALVEQGSGVSKSWPKAVADAVCSAIVFSGLEGRLKEGDPIYLVIQRNTEEDQ